MKLRERMIHRNMERERECEQALRFREWTILRFWGKDIMRDTEACVRAVEEAVEERKIFWPCDCVMKSESEEVLREKGII